MRKPSAILAGLKKRERPDVGSRSRVRVGMATCGISAGADAVYRAFAEAISDAGLANVDLISTGCVGRCDLEPMAEVARGAEPPVLYIRLDPEKAKRIVAEHLVGGSIVEELADGLHR